MDYKTIGELINSMGQLPTLPGIALKLLEAVNKEQTSLKEIGDILSTDPPLSARVLKLINSPFYGLGKKIGSVPQAVNLLGINTVKNLALSFSLVRNFQKENMGHFDDTLFWKSSLISAITSKMIAREALPAHAEDAFFLGLLHEIGILALLQCLPKQYSLVLEEKGRTKCSYHEAENQILGFNHMDFGGYLVKTWELPETFYVPIRYHHNPEKLETNDLKIDTLTRIIHLASLLTDFFNHQDNDLYLGLFEKHFKEYEFSKKFQVDDIVKQIQEKTVEIFPLFEVKLEADQNYVEIIERARSQLISVSTDLMNNLLEQKRQIELLREQATHDSLTGLYNYRHFQECLENEIFRAKRYSAPLSLIITDIDNFKRINDNHGHLAGNHALKEVAKYFKVCLRKSDILSRYGGEEFAIILPMTGPIEALAVAERMRENLSSLRMDFENKELTLTVSSGIVSLSPKEDISKIELIRRADGALYQAKSAGKNKCCVSD